MKDNRNQFSDDDIPQYCCQNQIHSVILMTKNGVEKVMTRMENQKACDPDKIPIGGLKFFSWKC